MRRVPPGRSLRPLAGLRAHNRQGSAEREAVRLAAKAEQDARRREAQDEEGNAQLPIEGFGPNSDLEFTFQVKCKTSDRLSHKSDESRSKWEKVIERSELST